MDVQTGFEHGGNEGSDRTSDGAHEGLIGCLTYQSRASSPPSEADLDALVIEARARNHAAGVTGMLLYEDGRFLQTLEGPPEGLAMIWASIRRDERHSDVEVLTEHLVAGRLFSDWDLLLYRKRDHAPRGLWERLQQRRQPFARHVPEIVKWSLDANERALNELLARLVEKGISGEEIVANLIEPAARAMGDAWLADECSEFDLTFGLGMLQMAAHALRYSRDPGSLRTSAYTILLACAPGEAHHLSPTLLADQFTDAGWAVEMIFPRNDEELARQVCDQRPDAVDIATSDALSRIDRVSQLRESVKQTRLSLPDTPLVVSVGGRLFTEAVATAEHVGADHARRSIAGTQLRIAELVNHAKSQPPRA
ncbi:MAG: BLUF domain-containing protein [Erythrobacter sp.]|nr:BLUF domain-containing protein [Erythrobacter sp.]